MRGRALLVAPRQRPMSAISGLGLKAEGLKAARTGRKLAAPSPRASMIEGALRRVDCIEIFDNPGAVAQHREQPPEHLAIDRRLEDQGRVPHHQPPDRLLRGAVCGAWRSVTGRDFAGIGKTRLECSAGVPVDHDDIMPGPGEIPGRCNADDAAAKSSDLQAFSLRLIGRRAFGCCWWSGEELRSDRGRELLLRIYVVHGDGLLPWEKRHAIGSEKGTDRAGDLQRFVDKI